MDKERLFRYLERGYYSKSEIMPHLPLGVDPDEIWEEMLQSRREKGIILPLTNGNGDSYWYLLTNKMIAASEVIVDELMEHETASELHQNTVSTIEEIYYTGFLEGAQISVQDAMEFLQNGEEPGSPEELILLNSRQAAGFAAENMYHAIDRNYLHNLAYFLTEGLDNGGGDFRMTDSMEIPSMQGEPILLPSADRIPEQASNFTCFLADSKTHPLIKAAAAQAWVLAVRPFPEGNERLARLLSNVILIRAGYRFFGEISISSVIARTSYDYFRAIANILRPENGADLTYFLEYYMTALSGTVHELRARQERQETETIETEKQMAVMPLAARLVNPGNDAAQEKSRRQTPQSRIGSRSKHQADCKLIADALQNLKNQGYTEFTPGDVSLLSGIERKKTTRLLHYFEDASQIILTKRSKTGYFYCFSDSFDHPDDCIETVNASNSEQDVPKYSDEVLQLILALEHSSSSPKDKRIGSMLHTCMDKGKITRDDYVMDKKDSFWSSDMKFAMQLGLIKAISPKEYIILPSINKDVPLLKSHREALTAIYNLFGGDSFSCEMVVANLDYSSSVISGMLHQFKWLKLVDYTTNEHNTYSYQLNVNPIDNPECFGEVA